MPWHELIKEVKVNENFSAVARVFLTACPRARLGMQCPSRLGTLPTPPGQKMWLLAIILLMVAGTHIAWPVLRIWLQSTHACHYACWLSPASEIKNESGTRYLPRWSKYKQVLEYQATTPARGKPAGLHRTWETCNLQFLQLLLLARPLPEIFSGVGMM